MAVIGLLGFIGSGKGTAAEYLVKEHNYTQDSFASSLKDACSVVFDWPRELLEGDTLESREWRDEVDVWWQGQLGIDQFTPRLCLQLFGTDAIRNHFHQDMWFLTVKNRIQKNPDLDIVISDVRFPNEIQMIRDLGGTLAQVVRGKDPVWYDVAVSANRGDEFALIEMQDCHSDVHFSEWAWAGEQLDVILDNNGKLDDLYKNINNML